MGRSLKLTYPYNTSANLEVEYQPNKWARVTPLAFRSFTGNRRIDGNSYDGPLYYEGTNTLYETQKQEAIRVIGIEELNEKKRIEQRRKYQRSYYKKRKKLKQ